MQTLSMNTIIFCHRTHSWKFDANADVKCEQGFKILPFLLSSLLASDNMRENGTGGVFSISDASATWSSVNIVPWLDESDVSPSMSHDISATWFKMPAMASEITEIFVDRWSRPLSLPVSVIFHLLQNAFDDSSWKMFSKNVTNRSWKDKVPSFLPEQKSRRRFVWPFVNDFRTANVARRTGMNAFTDYTVIESTSYNMHHAI